MRAWTRLAAALAVAALVLAGCGGSKPKVTSVSFDPKTKAVAGSVVVATNEGSFTIALDLHDSPHLVSSFEQLVGRKFYDGTVFFRIVPGFVIQGGDPTNTGAGDVGYTTVDPPPANTDYVHGVVAMAKSAAEAPGTAGSQFFVVTGADAQLPPDYAVLGHVTAGLDVVDRIGTFGDAQTERATKRIVVRQMTFKPA